MKETKKRLLVEEVRVGDVVQVFPGAFGAGIVTEVYLSRENKGEVWCLIERAHLSTGVAVGDEIRRHGQIKIGIERIDLPLSRVCELPVFVTGKSGKIDNR